MKPAAMVSGSKHSRHFCKIVDTSTLILVSPGLFDKVDILETVGNCRNCRKILKLSELSELSDLLSGHLTAHDDGARANTVGYLSLIHI